MTAAVPLKLPEQVVQIKRSYPRAPTRLMSQIERYTLAEIANDIGAHTVVETGVNDGAIAKWLIENVPTIIHYVGIDVPMRHMPNFLEQAGEVRSAGGMAFQHYDKFQMTVCQRGSFDLEPKDLPRADMFIIDCDHSEEAVLNDSALAAAVVNKGGVIVWRDCDAVDVLESICESGRHLVQISGTRLVMERR